MSNQNYERVFFSSIAAHILGKKTNVKLTGSPSKVDATKGAIKATKRLYEALGRTNVELEQVHQLIHVKNHAAAKFKKETGLTWIL
jgi:hypothetical protein